MLARAPLTTVADDGGVRLDGLHDALHEVLALLQQKQNRIGSAQSRGEDVRSAFPSQPLSLILTSLDHFGG